MFQGEIMKKLFLFYVAFSVAVVLPGCGKKKQEAKPEAKSGIRSLFSSADKKGLPLYTGEREAILDDSVSEFAFVDENAAGKAGKTSEKEEELLASADIDDNVKALEFDRVQFNFDKHDIRADQKTVVKHDVEKAKELVKEGKDVVVAGHTCQIGSAAYNLALSQKRADAVRKEMVQAGIPADHVKTVGYGYESPLVWSDAADRETKIKELSPNRRAEVSVN